MINYDVVNVPIVDIVNQIILYASQNRASDIHLDPHEDHLLIRMRIDGELRDHTKIPKAYERNLVTRIKLISNMNITETRLPQDGNIRGNIEGRDLDMRVSVLPTNEGEKVVIRILDYSKSLDGIESLGFSEKNFELLKNMLEVPNGIILVTGATGSGKSTTTYSMLQALNKENTNIITVEDPVEMNIEGINQVHVNSEIGLTFAAALRSILRQDPNVILIGEIRDSETAQIAVRASITGHLVLSTIHTNNSLNTIERLLDMDVERYLLSSALTGIISQKLARKLCDKCKTQRKATDYEKEVFRIVLGKNIDYVYDPGGCPECTEGYRGRIALQEVLYISDELRTAIANENTTKDDLKVLVYSGNVTTLLGDGLEKIEKGITSFNEIFRLIEVDLELRSLREDSEKIKKKKEEREREEQERIAREREEIERVERTRAEIQEQIGKEKGLNPVYAANISQPVYTTTVVQPEYDAEKRKAEIELEERTRAEIKEKLEQERKEQGNDEINIEKIKAEVEIEERARAEIKEKLEQERKNQGNEEINFERIKAEVEAEERARAEIKEKLEQEKKELAKIAEQNETSNEKDIQNNSSDAIINEQQISNEEISKEEEIIDEEVPLIGKEVIEIIDVKPDNFFEDPLTSLFKSIEEA